MGLALVVVDLIVDPADPWALDVLRVWLILLGSHLVALVAGWVTWRAARPERWAELLGQDVEQDEAQPAAPAPVGPPRPLPATGRFAPGHGRTATDPDPDSGDDLLTGALETIGDAVLDLGDLAREGGSRLRRGVARGVEWIQGDEEFDDEIDDAAIAADQSTPPASSAPPSPARWVVPTGGTPSGAKAAESTQGSPATPARPRAPIVPIPRQPPMARRSPASVTPESVPKAAPARPAQPTPITPAPPESGKAASPPPRSDRREVSGR